MGLIKMWREPYQPAPKPTWTCPHCGFFYRLADLKRIDNYQQRCKQTVPVWGSGQLISRLVSAATFLPALPRSPDIDVVAAEIQMHFDESH
jgi:hypothetical protein